MRRNIQVAGQFLTAGSGGIARCARLTIKALAPEARVTGLAVEDREPTTLGEVTTRAFGGSRAAFVAANALAGLSSDWVIYDFAGTARAHAPLRLLGKPYALWVHGLEVWPGNLRDDYATAIRGAQAVFVNSRHTYERLSQSMPGLRTMRLCLLGTEKDIGARPPAGELAGRDRAVLFVGRNDEMQVFQIREEKRAQIPAVTHVDGSGRLQTVHRAANPRYYGLIEAFEALTGVPMVLNTSFNENEPVVCQPQEALDCFLRTRMDMLVLGDRIVERLPTLQAGASAAEMATVSS